MEDRLRVRRGTFYPFVAGRAWSLPDGTTRTRYLRKVKEIGFDGIELGVDNFGGPDASEAEVRGLARELDEEGTPCVAVRAGGGLCQPNVAEQNRQRLGQAIVVAGWLGAGIVNTALGTPPRNRTLDSGPTGAPTSHGSSQLAGEEDFVRTAEALHEAGEVAGAAGIDITVEVHQHSIADNSWATLHLAGAY